MRFQNFSPDPRRVSLYHLKHDRFSRRVTPHHNLNLNLYSHLFPCNKSQLTLSHCRWIARVGKTEALATAGITLPPSGSEDVNGVPEVIQKNRGAVKVVAFNVVSVAAYFCSLGSWITRWG